MLMEKACSGSKYACIMFVQKNIHSDFSFVNIKYIRTQEFLFEQIEVCLRKENEFTHNVLF